MDLANTVPDRDTRFMTAFKGVQAMAERYALSLTSDRDDAKDLLQEAIAIVWRKFDDLLDPAAFKSYLLTVMTNLHRRRFRRRQIFTPLEDDLAETVEDTYPQPDITTEGALLRDALAQLSDKAREAVILFEIEDLSVAEIAKIQRSSVSAVKVRLFRARRQLMQILGISTTEPQRPTVPLL